MGVLDLDDAVAPAGAELGDADEVLVAVMAGATNVNTHVAASAQDAVDALIRARANLLLPEPQRAFAVRREVAHCRARVTALGQYAGHSARYLRQAEARAMEAPEVAGNPEFAAALRDLLASHGRAAYALAEASAAGDRG